MSGGKALVTTGVGLGLLVYMMPDSKATFNPSHPPIPAVTATVAATVSCVIVTRALYYGTPARQSVSQLSTTGRVEKKLQTQILSLQAKKS